MAEKRLIDVSKWDGYYTARKRSLAVYDPYCDGYEDALDHVDDWMNARPTVDAVEVVRCKDCKHFTEGMAVGMCKRVPDKPIIPVAYNHFCSYGERKDNGSL